MRENLPTRKHIRLEKYDYSKKGLYFITICTKNRECILSNIKDNQIIKLTKEGNILDNNIKMMEKIYHNIIIDEYVIMPNHIHMILIINKKEYNSISRIIKQLKGITSKKIGDPIWQKLFYEHIIRNEKEYLKIKEYIINNPLNWNTDKYF